MRPFLIIVTYLTTALLLGAALAWPLQIALQPFAEISLYRLMTRTGMIIALIGIYPLIRYLEVNTMRALGLELSATTFVTEIVKGLFIGSAIMLALVIMLFYLNILVPETTKPVTANIVTLILIKALLAGLLISLIEEGFFRGAVYQAILQHSNLLMAAVLSSALYASLHFIDTDVRGVAGQGDWLSGFSVLADSLTSFLMLETIVDSLLALFMAGMFLSLVREYTGNIAQCMGIHTGWIIVIKLTRYLTDTNQNADYAALVGSYNGIIGYLAAAWLAILTYIYWLTFRTRPA